MGRTRSAQRGVSAAGHLLPHYPQAVAVFVGFQMGNALSVSRTREANRELQGRGVGGGGVCTRVGGRRAGGEGGVGGGLGPLPALIGRVSPCASKRKPIERTRARAGSETARGNGTCNLSPSYGKCFRSKACLIVQICRRWNFTLPLVFSSRHSPFKTITSIVSGISISEGYLRAAGGSVGLRWQRARRGAPPLDRASVGRRRTSLPS